jgi:hypothetical protein
MRAYEFDWRDGAGQPEKLRPDEGFHQPIHPLARQPISGRQSACSRAW